MAYNKFGKQYGSELRSTEHGASLYHTWRTVRRHDHCEEWDYFPTFYDWAMNNGFELGAKMFVLDANKPYSADNCIWFACHKDETLFDHQRIRKWNKTVNRIRKHYGMPPLEGTSYAEFQL